MHTNIYTARTVKGCGDMLNEEHMTEARADIGPHMML